MNELFERKNQNISWHFLVTVESTQPSSLLPLKEGQPGTKNGRWMKRTGKLILGFIFSLGLLALVAGAMAGTARADAALSGPTGLDDFQISSFGPDGDTQYETMRPSVAANPAAKEFLVVWEGRAPGNASEIYGRRIDADTGLTIDTLDQPISAIGAPAYTARRPDVVFNPVNQEYLVVWYGDTPTTGDDVIEIFGQRLNAATGQPVGDRIAISEVDAYPALSPKVTYNADDHEFLVAWIGNSPADSAYEVYSRRLDATTGQVLVGGEIRISEMGPENDPDYLALGLDLVYNPIADEYLVAWSGVHNYPGTMAPGEIEVYGQRLRRDGARFGPFNFRMSYLGDTGDAAYTAGHPSIAFNHRDNQYLVVYTGEDDGGGLVEGEFEIWGSRIRPGPDYVQITHLRLSQTGGQGDSAWSALDPSVAYDGNSNEFFITWSADAPNNLVPKVGDDFEIYGARLAPDQNTIPEAFFLSEMGVDFFDGIGRAFQPAVAYNEANRQYLTVWRGDDGLSPLVDDEYEIFGQLYLVAEGQPQPTPTPPPPSPTPSPSPTPAATYKNFLPYVSR
jgi:hypothetical protein